MNRETFMAAVTPSLERIEAFLARFDEPCKGFHRAVFGTVPDIKVEGIPFNVEAQYTELPSQAAWEVLLHERSGRNAQESAPGNEDEDVILDFTAADGGPLPEDNL